MTKTIDEIWADVEAHDAKLRAEYDARRARQSAAWARLPAVDPLPTIVGPIAPMSDYHASVARGWSTD